MERRKVVLREMKICRFCLSSDEKELTSFYQRDVKMAPLTVQIMSCVSIEVFPNDGLPQLICNSCKQQTNQSYIFKSNCKKADDALKNFLRTGDLIKPDFPKIQTNVKKIPASISPVKDVKIVEDNQEENPCSKRVKLDDGTEIITLCITQSENSIPDESSQDSIAIEDEEMESQTFEDDSSQLEEPVKQVETAIFSCNQCDKTFPLKQLLDLHVQNHTREREFSCTTCGNEFFTKYDLLAHEKTHSPSKPFTCSLCLKVFCRETQLRKHEQTHSDNMKYVCLYCEKKYIHKDHLNNHMKKHEIKRPFTCKECDKSFVFKQGLERHMTSVHALDKPHKCNYCESAFSSQIRLTRHITSHAGLRPYPCKICARTFLLSHHLTRHMRSHFVAFGQGRQSDGLVGQHKCDICSMSFKRKDNLINHSAIHSMVNLRCVICNTIFDTAEKVKEHITTHLQVLPYPCEKCDYSFETQDQLEEHELKHAEMEYEEQIEQEVISERKKHSINNESDSEDGDEVTEYHITDIENPKLVPSTQKSDTNTSFNITPQSSTELNSLFKPINKVADKDEVDEESIIRPIFRMEGTKVYERKGPIQRKIPKVSVENDNLKTAPLEQINEKPHLESVGIPPDGLSNLPSKKPVNVKVGDKVVKVQKFIVTKEEMKQMAKLGILEIKNGQVIMKNPGQPILNATIKPVQPSDIENMLNSQKQKTPLKQYERKSS